MASSSELARRSADKGNLDLNQRAWTDHLPTRQVHPNSGPPTWYAGGRFLLSISAIVYAMVEREFPARNSLIVPNLRQNAAVPKLRVCKSLIWKDLVGASGFEPPTSWSRTRRSVVQFNVIVSSLVASDIDRFAESQTLRVGHGRNEVSRQNYSVGSPGNSAESSVQLRDI